MAQMEAELHISSGVHNLILENARLSMSGTALSKTKKKIKKKSDRA